MNKTRDEVVEILKNMTYSYSSVNSFATCPLMFNMSYLDKKNRTQNIFAEIGSATHAVFEKYLLGEFEIFELDRLFLDIYPTMVTMSAPAMLEKYNYEQNTRDKITRYFRDISFDRDDYENLCIEGKVEYVIDGIKIVIKPDAILRRKSDGKVILYDYKTSTYKKETHEGYAYQLSLYGAIYEIVEGIHIDEMNIIYVKETVKPRNKPLQYGRIVPIVFDENVLLRFIQDVKNILDAEEFPANPDQFFCCNICSFRNVCETKQNLFGI